MNNSRPSQKELFDQLYKNCSGWFWQKKPDKILEELVKKIGRGKAVLEVGCGEGRNLVLLSSLFSEVVGLDFSPEALKRAQSNYPDLCSKIKFIQAGVPLLPFVDQSFDLVLCWDTMSHLKPREFKTSIAEFYRVLFPSGHLIVNTFSRPHPSYNHPKEIYLRYYPEKEVRKIIEGSFRLLISKGFARNDPLHPGLINHPHQHFILAILAQKEG